MAGSDKKYSMNAQKRTDFRELMNKDNRRYSYALVAGNYPDFSNVKPGDISSVLLFNKDSQAYERLEFKITHNEYFPLVDQQHVYGLVLTSDGNTVRIEFCIHWRDIDASDVRAYLRAPVFQPRVSPVD